MVLRAAIVLNIIPNKLKLKKKSINESLINNFLYKSLVFSRGRLSWRLQSTCEAFPAGLADADTIFALSSGHGRCGVAVVRVSGPASATALKCMAGLKRNLPPPRTALLRSITDPKGKEVLDRGLVLWFPGQFYMSGQICA